MGKGKARRRKNLKTSVQDESSPARTFVIGRQIIVENHIPLDKNAQKIHGIGSSGFSSDSDSGKSEFDEEYYQNRPDPIAINRRDVVVVGKDKHPPDKRVPPNNSYSSALRTGISPTVHPISRIPDVGEGKISSIYNTDPLQDLKNTLVFINSNINSKSNHSSWLDTRPATDPIQPAASSSNTGKPHHSYLPPSDYAKTKDLYKKSFTKTSELSSTASTKRDEDLHSISKKRSYESIGTKNQPLKRTGPNANMSNRSVPFSISGPNPNTSIILPKTVRSNVAAMPSQIPINSTSVTPNKLSQPTIIAEQSVSQVISETSRSLVTPTNRFDSTRNTSTSGLPYIAQQSVLTREGRDSDPSQFPSTNSNINRGVQVPKDRLDRSRTTVEPSAALEQPMRRQENVAGERENPNSSEYLIPEDNSYYKVIPGEHIWRERVFDFDKFYSEMFLRLYSLEETVDSQSGLQTVDDKPTENRIDGVIVFIMLLSSYYTLCLIFVR